MEDRASNVTGIWQGLYSYSRSLDPASFIATLIETQSRVTGTTHEAHRKTGETLCAMVTGSREGHLVHFIKRYEQAGEGYGADVRYEGTLTPDGTEIEGRWIIRADWFGRFLMIRGTRDAEAVARKKFARV